MQTFSVSYSFNQRFPISAREAFDWCTDYRSDDYELMGEKGRRGIRRVTKDTILLEEQVIQGSRTVRKLKLVKINPRRLSWHNIQLQGPNKYSEFIYEIRAEGENASTLSFTGLLVVYAKRSLTRNRLGQIAEKEREYDSKAWKLLAKAMAKELRQPDLNR